MKKIAFLDDGAQVAASISANQGDSQKPTDEVEIVQEALLSEKKKCDHRGPIWVIVLIGGQRKKIQTPDLCLECWVKKNT